jgi:hypothetical protein
MMKYELEKGLSLLLPPRRRRHHHHHSLFCAAAAAIIIVIVEASRSRSAHVVAGTRRHKRALEASSAKIVTKVKMIEVCNRHRTCDVQIWSQALTQLSYLILLEVGEKCFFVVNFTSSHDWDFTFNFKRLRQR